MRPSSASPAPRPQPVATSQLTPRRAPLRRRDLFAALGIALSGLLLAACPRKGNRTEPTQRPGGSMYRRY